MLLILFIILVVNSYEDFEIINHQEIFEYILRMNELRSKRHASQIQLLYDEQIYELYEENLENQIKRNKEIMEKSNFVIEKYYLPKKTCLEGILDSIQIMEPLFHLPTYDQETLNTYFYSVDQLNFRSSCYQVLQTITDQDIELKSKEEIEKMELFQEYFDKYYQNDYTQNKVFIECKAMDFRKKLEEFTDLFIDDNQKIIDVTKQMMHKAKTSFIVLRDILQPETDQAIYQYNIQKQRYDLLREKEVFLKQQIFYNDEAFQVEQTQHIHLRDSVDKQLADQESKLEQLYNGLSDESKQNVLNMIKVQNWDIMKNQEEEEFRKQAQKFNPGRRQDYDL